MDPRLVSLHLRRGLHPWLVAALGLVVVFALTAEPRADWSGEMPSAAAWRRRDVWVAGFAVLWPAAVVRGARLVGSWRARDLDWLAPRASGLGRALAAGALGVFAALVALLSVVGAIAELAGDDGPRLVDRGWIAGVEAPDATGIDERRWTLAVPPTADGAHLAVPVELRGYHGPSVDVELELTRGDQRTAWTGRLSRARELEVELPAGEGDVVVRLARVSDGAALALPRVGAHLLTPAGGLAGSLGIAWRLALAAALSIGLAIGCGAWMSVPSACLAAAAPWVVAWFADTARWLPAADLWSVLDDLTRRRAADAPDLATIAVALLGALLGIALARLGLARQRRAA